TVAQFAVIVAPVPAPTAGCYHRPTVLPSWSPPMRALTAAVLCSLVAVPALADTRGFDVRDLVTLERVSDPQVSPDGTLLVYAVRETDLENNKGVNSLWLRRLDRRDDEAVRLTPAGESWSSARFA